MKLLKIAQGISLVILLPTACVAFQWETSDSVTWSSDCNFHGDDVRRLPSKSNECEGLCSKDENCTHFTWTSRQRGTCLLKSKIVKDPSRFKERATYQQGFICGFADIVWRNSTSLPGVRWASNCEFPGDGVQEKSSLPEECGRLCAKNPTCDHFSWKAIEGVGTCTMKHGGPTIQSTKYRLKASCGIVDTVKTMNQSKNGLDRSSSNRTASIPVFYGILKFLEKHVFGSEWMGIETDTCQLLGKKTDGKS